MVLEIMTMIAALGRDEGKACLPPEKDIIGKAPAGISHINRSDGNIKKREGCRIFRKQFDCNHHAALNDGVHAHPASILRSAL